MTIIDAHCHIYPEKIAQKAVESIGAFYHLSMHQKGDVVDLLEAHEQAGISHAIVHSVATTQMQVPHINRFIAQTVQENKEQFTGLGTLHPNSLNLEKDVEYLRSLGLHGVKLHPDFQHFKLDDAICMPMYELCQAYHLPILIHTGDKRYDYSNPNRLVPVLQKFKNLTVIGAHFGGWSMWTEATEKLNKYQNLCVDCSSSLYAMNKEQATQIIRSYGADRVMFGSDYPMWSPKDEVQRVLDLNLTTKEKDAVFFQTAQRVYDIEF